MWLQLPLSSEHSLSAERITLVTAHFAVCCPSLLCLRGCLSWPLLRAGLGDSVSSHLALSHANPAALIESLCKSGMGQARAGSGPVLCYVGLCMEMLASPARHTCQDLSARVTMCSVLVSCRYVSESWSVLRGLVWPSPGVSNSPFHGRVKYFIVVAVLPFSGRRKQEAGGFLLGSGVGPLQCFPSADTHVYEWAGRRNKTSVAGKSPRVKGLQAMHPPISLPEKS